MNTMRFITYVFLTLIGLVPGQVFGAIGCTLSNPAADLKYLYPDTTGFREEIREFHALSDGRALYDQLKSRLGTDLDPVYEAFDTPFTVYSVFKGQERIGVVHGVNVPGQGGVIQVFIATDPVTGEIREFFFQRLESREARALKDKGLRQRFRGLALADFYKHDYFVRAEPANPNDRLGGILQAVGPVGGGTDFRASIRGLRKNLILLDMFVYRRMAEPFFQRTQDLLAGRVPAGSTSGATPRSGSPSGAAREVTPETGTAPALTGGETK